MICNEPSASERFVCPQPGKVGFANGLASTCVAMENVKGHLLVQVMLNGQGPFRMILDCGCHNALSVEVAKALGLKALGSATGRGAGEGSEAVALVKVDRLGIGEAWLEHQPFFVTQAFSEHTKATGIREDGALGYEVLKRFVARLEHSQGKLTLSRAEGWSYQGPGTLVPFEFNGHHPRVEGELDGIPGKFDLDTGSGAILDVYSPFVEQHDLIAKAQAGVQSTGHGIGGSFKDYEVHCGELKISGLSMKSPLVNLVTSRTGEFADPTGIGNVGEGFLKAFDITFDYPRKRIYLEPIAR